MSESTPVTGANGLEGPGRHAGTATPLNEGAAGRRRFPIQGSAQRGVLGAALALAVLGAGPAWAQDVALAGIMGNRALLVVNGGQPQAVAVGKKSREGVLVVSVAQGAAVVLTTAGERTIRVGEQALRMVGEQPKVVLRADRQGHFFTEGSVNGAAMKFLVDTGATLLSMSRVDAERARLDMTRGEPITTMTADGPVRSWKVQAEQVRIGEVVVRNVEVSVLEATLPVVLLGMSFLNKVEMRQDGEQMTLATRQ